MHQSGKRSGFVFKLVLALSTIEYAFLFGFVIVGDILRVSPDVAGDPGLSVEEAVHLAGALGFVAVVLGGLATQAVSPVRLSGGLLVSAAAILAVMISAIIVGNPNNQGGQAGVFDFINLIFLIPVLSLIALHPDRSSLFRGDKGDPIMLAVVIVAAVPLFLYGVNEGLTQRNSWPPRSDPHHNAHWLTMANVGFAVPLIALVGALRIRGWKIAALAAGGLAAILGLTSAFFPDAASSVGVLPGALAAFGGVALILWALRQPA